jgi:hypothetical protein
VSGDASPLDGSAATQQYRIEGVVTAPGIEPTAVTHGGVTAPEKWPRAGDRLPCTVDRSQPDRLVIHWDQVQTSGEHARAAAQRRAQELRTGSPGTPSPTSPGDIAEVTERLARRLDPVVQRLDTATILATGKPGTATLLSMFDVPISPKDNLHKVVGLVLNVTLEGGAAPYETRSGHNVPLELVPRLLVGMTLPVKANPTNLLQAAVDWDRVAQSPVGE